MAAGSFTERVIAEVAPHVPPLRCCRAALVQGMLDVGAPGTEGVDTARRAAARAGLAAVHGEMPGARVEAVAAPRGPRYRISGVDPAALRSSERRCCARSRLRGAFLAAGLISRADGPAHLELPCRTERSAEILLATLAELDIPAQRSLRRGRPVVLVRSTEGVARALSSIGAQSARLLFEEGRVMGDLRGAVNRRNNAETANLRRTVDAAVRQLEAIALLRSDARRWDRLPPALREAAQLRTAHPHDSLESLAARLGLSRSAAAGRLHRLLAAAGEGGEHGPRRPGGSVRRGSRRVP